MKKVLVFGTLDGIASLAKASTGRVIYIMLPTLITAC